MRIETTRAVARPHAWLWPVVAALAVALAVTAMAGPWGFEMLDLKVYRLGAQALLDGSNVFAVREPGSDLPFTYPPFAVLLFIPYALMPLSVAKVGSAVVSLTALWVMVYLSARHVVRPATARQHRGEASSGSNSAPAEADWPEASRDRVLAWSVPLTLIAATAHPVLDTLLFGQVNLLLAALVMIDVLLVRGRWRGVLTGVATGTKLVTGLFIVYFLVTRQWRAGVNSAASLAATVALGFVVAPRGSWAFWTGYVFDPSRTGLVAFPTNQSVTGAVSRLTGNAHPGGALILGLSVLVAVVALVVAARWHRQRSEFAALCVVAAGSLLASPISWTHHWVWLIPMVAWLISWARGASTGRPGQARSVGRAPLPSGSWRWALTGAVTAALWVGAVRFVPKTDLATRLAVASGTLQPGGVAELHYNPAQQVLANYYVVLALAFLAWTAWAAFKPGAQPSTRS